MNEGDMNSDDKGGLRDQNAVFIGGNYWCVEISGFVFKWSELCIIFRMRMISVSGCMWWWTIILLIMSWGSMGIVCQE